MGAPHVVWMLALLLENAAQQPSPTPSDDLELVWRAPPQCPSTDTVHGMILDKLAEHPGDTRPVSASALVDATVTAGDQTYHLDLRVRTQGSLMQREIAARDCALLARTTGLVVGLALDSTVSIETVAKTMEQQPDADDDPMAPVPPAPTGDPVADVVGVPIIETPPSDALVSRERSSASRAPLAVALRLSGGADVGILPRVGGGLGSSVAVAGPRWRAEIHASRWFSRAQTFPGEASVGANFAMWSGGARGCLVLGERVEIPICGGAEIGQIQAAGFGA
ncbi:MAG: hypothetical protein K0V04_40595, partial [Deltaproteobacteria bacterium]|nr:hypothetical protein [Deltaproteobacteria bacterium]